MKDKTPIIDDFVKYKKSKRNKHDTECKVKTRSYEYCGICGSSNIITTGVEWCPDCGQEREVFTDEPFYLGLFNYKFCHCGGHSSTNDILIANCIDCGAHTIKCPKCGSIKSFGLKRCWQDITGKFKCQNCGFSNL